VTKILYEKLELLPRPLPNGLRNFPPIWSARGGESILSEDLEARLTSSKFSVAPEGWQVRKKGTETPCRWHWAISSGELGKYDVILDLSQAFQSYLPDHLKTSPQLLFHVEVRSSIGLSLRTVKILKYLAIGTGAVISTVVTFILSLPVLKNYVSEMIRRWLS
jgi:hypothetical protein